MLFGGNYSKDGKGISKDEPKKKGIALFFELYTRKFSSYVLLNVLYMAASLPAAFVYFLIVTSRLEITNFRQLTQCIFLAFTLVIILGGGPASGGYNYVLRNFVREEHSFVLSDFFEHTWKNIIQSTIMFFLDVIMLYAFVFNTGFYFEKLSDSSIYPLLMALFIGLCVIYVMVHFYIYSIMVTFKLNIWQIIRNSFLLTLMSFFRCLLGILIAGIYFYLLSFMEPAITILLLFILGASPVGLVFHMVSYKFIKKYMLDPATAPEDEEDKTNKQRSEEDGQA